jgi:capsular polysaccharide biosynthesis protein
MAITLPFALRAAREVFGGRTLFSCNEQNYLSAPPVLWNWRCRSAAETRQHFAHFVREKVACPREMIIEFRDAILIDGKYVLSRERLGVGESFADVWGDEDFVRRMAAVPDAEGMEPVRDIGLPVLHICKEGAENFGHLLVEILPKLVHALAIGIKQCRIPLPADAAMMQPLITDVGSALGMQLEFLICPRDSTLRVERLLWCGPVSRHNARKSPTLLALANALLAVAPPSQHTGSLYVTRPPGSFRQIINNAEVEDLVRQRGYTVVEPSQLPLREQIALFRGASTVVGPIGAGLTHAVFMPAEARIGMLDSGLGDRFYWDLACLKRQEFTWMFLNEVKPFERQRIIAPYSVDLSVLRSALDWFAGAGGPAAC